MEQIDVRILDRDYRLAVPSDEKERLLDAVRVVDQKMRSIRDGGRISGLDRIAVMAALQLAHDLVETREVARSSETTRAAAPGEAARRIREMTESLDAELRRQESLF